MASKENAVLQSLEEEVQCPLCMDVLKEPKRLPCEHVLCDHCLEGLQRSTGGALVCPVCRDHTPLQDSKQFPSSQEVVRLADMYREILKEQLAAEASGNEFISCSLHSYEPLVMYCETCRKTVCRDCFITSCSKKDHECGYARDMSRKYLEQLKQCIEPVQTFQDNVRTAQLTVASNEKIVLEQQAEHRRRITERFDELVGILQHDRATLLSAVDRSYSEIIARNVDQKRLLSSVSCNLDTCLQSVLSLSDDPVAKIHEVVPKTNEQVKLLLEQFKDLSLQPVQPQLLDMEIPEPEDLKKLCQDNFVFGVGDIYKGHFDRHLLHTSLEMTMNALHQFNLQAYSIPRVSRLKSKLVTSLDGSSISVSVAQVSADTYQLSVIPVRRGRHKLHLQCGDTHLCGSPIPVHVYFHPQEISQLKKKLQVRISASSVRCHDGVIYVKEVGRGICQVRHSNSDMVVNRTVTNDTASVGTFTLHEDHFYIADVAKQVVFKTDMNGVVLKTVGVRVTRQESYRRLSGIRVSTRSHVHVCDAHNHTVEVFDKDLNFLRSFGRKGQGPGEFRSPNDLDFDERGNIYVVEEGNKRLQVFTEDGRHSHFIGGPTSSFSGFKLPLSAAVYREHIYITDFCLRCVVVFTLSGDFVATIGDDKLSPESIAVDEDGYIFVTDYRCRLVRF